MLLLQAVQTFTVASFQEQANIRGTLKQTSRTLVSTCSLSRRLEWIFWLQTKCQCRCFETHKQNRDTFFFCLRPAVAIGCRREELFQALINSRAANRFATAGPTAEWWAATGSHSRSGWTIPLNDGLTMRQVWGQTLLQQQDVVEKAC